MDKPDKLEFDENLFSIVDPIIPGVYFLMNKKKEVVYVGESMDMFSRIRCHKSNTRCFFRFVSYLVIHDEVQRKETEVKYIQHFKPRYNLKGNPDWEHQQYVVINYLSYHGRASEITLSGGVPWEKMAEVLNEMGMKPKTKDIRPRQKEYEQSK